MNNLYIQQDSLKEILNQIVIMNMAEFFLYIIIAIVIGYLIHYTFSHRRDYFRTPKKNPAFYYKKSLNNTYYANTEPIIIPQKETVITRKLNQEKTSRENNNHEYVRFSSRDDLKIIEGIGPKIETILNKAKISTWYRLSKTNVRKLKSILDSAGHQYHMHDPSTWPEQAHLAETRQWEKLKRLQNNLNGGKYI